MNVSKSIDFHIGLPGTLDECNAVAALLRFLNFKVVKLPEQWKESGLQWFQKDGLQIQLIPKSFARMDSHSRTLQNAMVTFPHVAFVVDRFPSQKKIKSMGLYIIEGPLTRPDGLQQLYLMGHSRKYFIELNTRISDLTVKK